MMFIRIPSFLMKGMANLYAVDTSSYGCVSLSSAWRKEIVEKQVKAVLSNKAKPTASVEPFVTTAKERFGRSSSSKTSVTTKPSVDRLSSKTSI